MAPRRKKTSKVEVKEEVFIEENVTFESVICPICRSILSEPVTLPCGHHFCFGCFNGTVDNAALACPLCRQRIGTWLRQTKKKRSLINESLWKCIQNKFPEFIQLKYKGQDDLLDEHLPQTKIVVATPGEIKKEYEKERAREEAAIRLEREQEELKSQSIIQQLQEEEEQLARLEADKLKSDEELARKLAAEEENKQKLASTTTPRRGPLDSFVVLNKSTLLPKNGMSKRQKLLEDSVEVMRNVLNGEDDDTIDREITHIKPISLAPRTPEKTIQSGTIIRSTPLRLSLDHTEIHQLIKSPVPVNLLNSPADHRSAFQLASPNKQEIPIDFLSTTEVVNKAIKRIDFSENEENQAGDHRFEFSPLGSPFKGFDSHPEEECPCANFLNKCLISCRTNNNNRIDNAMLLESKEDIIQQQQKLEAIIRQENEDLLYAQKLHEELNKAERTRTYELRTLRSSSNLINTPEKSPKSSRKRRQSKINELYNNKKVKIQ